MSRLKNKFIKTVLDRLVVRECQNHLNGFALSVTVEGEIIWRHFKGLSSRGRELAVTQDTLFLLASVTKLFTASALLYLEERSRLTLDQQIQIYVPESRFVKSEFSNFGEVPLSNLAAHTSGLPRELPGDYTKSLTFPTFEQVVELLPQVETILPAGVKYHYSNLGYVLLGRAIETVTGKNFHEFLREAVLEPLDLQVTGPQPVHDNVARGQMPGADGVSVEAGCLDAKAFSPAGQLYTTIDDLENFLLMLMGEKVRRGRSPLGSASLIKMRRPCYLDPIWKEGAGLGWHIARVADVPVWFHDGRLQGCSTCVMVQPRERISVILLSNSVVDALGVSKRIMKACLTGT